LIGVRGAISENWDYDATVQYSKVKTDTSTNNYFHIQRLIRSLDAVDEGLPTATPHSRQRQRVCRSVVDGTDPNCIPYNPFRIGGVTEEALDYLQVPGIQTGTIEQEVYTASVTGTSAASGCRARSPRRASRSCSVSKSGSTAWTTSRTTCSPLRSFRVRAARRSGYRARRRCWILFTEVRIPLVQDAPFADQLGLDAAYRYSDYDTDTTDTYKIGLDWAPIPDIKFRGSFQRAVRAANVVELFTAQGFNLFDLPGDPCGTDLAGPRAKPPAAVS
jgi:hypothetical protein